MYVDLRIGFGDLITYFGNNLGCIKIVFLLKETWVGYPLFRFPGFFFSPRCHVFFIRLRVLSGVLLCESEVACFLQKRSERANLAPL